MSSQVNVPTVHSQVKQPVHGQFPHKHPAQLQELIYLSSICCISEIHNFEYIQHFGEDSLFLFTTSCQYSVRLRNIPILSLLGFPQEPFSVLPDSYTYNGVVEPKLV